jgi:23S rRNA U2552 (ribose-2'-O)-methylase RlmE/FtsJ
MAKAKSGSSRRWLRQHESDPYVLASRREGYRSRASYKLLELDRAYKLFRPGQVVVDLGAAPGGWAQVAARRIAPGGRLFVETSSGQVPSALEVLGGAALAVTHTTDEDTAANVLTAIRR